MTTKQRRKRGEIRLRIRPAKYLNGRPIESVGDIEFGLPFMVKRYLIHRVRSIHQHHDGNGNKQHRSADLWCGNSGFPDRDTNVMTDDPPAGRLLCESCERNAVNQGEPTTEKLCGRHVHTGRLVAIQTCHVEERESN